MSFQQGRKLSKYLMFGSALILFTAALTNRDLPTFSAVLAVAGLVFCVGGAIATLILCRCPFCRQIIVMGALNRKDCPSCRRRFDDSKGKIDRRRGPKNKAKK